MTKNPYSPLVSIIIPVYNGSNFIREAIDSALAQTYPNIEIIVVNDGSTDNGKTDIIVRSYGDKIRYYKKKNGGVSSAINYGIDQMKGDFFSWLSHDDVYCQNKIQAEIDYLNKHNLLHKKVILFSDYQIIDRRGNTIADFTINHSLATKHPSYALLRGAINGNSLLIPKSAWKEYGKLDERLICTQDYEKWYEMSKTYTFTHIPEILIKSRYHSGQVTNTSPLVKTEGNAFWTKVIKAHSKEDRQALNGSDYNFYYYFIEYLKNTPYDEALSYCKEQLEKYPSPDNPIPPENFIKHTNIQLFSKNPIIHLAQLIDREGAKNTFMRIKNKIHKTIKKG